MKKIVLSRYMLLMALLFTLLMAMSPDVVLSRTLVCMELCMQSVIPALFPFFVCSSLLVDMGGARVFARFFTPIMGPVFGMSGSGSLPVVMGLLSGYPVGARTTADLAEKKIVSHNEAERLLAFCNNSGPLFILGAVGAGMLRSPEQGLILYISQLFASITTGMLMKLYRIENANTAFLPTTNTKIESFAVQMENAIIKAGKNILAVCGYIIMFNILIAFLEKYGIYAIFENLLTLSVADPHLASPIFFGFFEVTTGCREAAGLFPPVNLLIISCIIGWSGLSVHMQVIGHAKRAGLSLSLYFRGKLLQSILSPIYTGILLWLLSSKMTHQVFSPSFPNTIYAAGFIAAYMVVGIFVIAVLLLFWHLWEFLKSRLNHGLFAVSKRKRPAKLGN